MKETLRKFFNEPGLCSLEELEETQKFILDLKDKLDLYASELGYVPQGATLDVHIDKVRWYIDRDKQLHNAEY